MRAVASFAKLRLEPRRCSHASCEREETHLVCDRVFNDQKYLPVSRLSKPSESFLQGKPVSLRTPLMLFLISLGAIAAVWWWLGIPVNLARAPIDLNDKLQCISYAPFRSRQTSLSPATQVSREQIAEDL